ncbi:MAG: ribosome maturation factor RimP [Acidimicrobiales bacterium]
MTVEVSVVERVRTIVEPLLVSRSVGLYDVELSGSTLRILVETGDLEVIASVTRAISHALDDADPIPDRYTLEVSSPGLERPLRTPTQFGGAIGTVVTLKTVPGTDGDRRLRGTIVAADGDTVTVRVDGAERTLRYPDIERARTVFEWGARPKPNAPAAKAKQARRAAPSAQTTEKAKSR